MKSIFWVFLIYFSTVQNYNTYVLIVSAKPSSFFSLASEIL